MDTGYKVIQSDVMTAATEDDTQVKAFTELLDSLGSRVKSYDPDTFEMIIYTGGASSIKIHVAGYEDGDLVKAAKAQEDAVVEDETSDALPPTDNIPYTESYMRPSIHNPRS